MGSIRHCPKCGTEVGVDTPPGVWCRRCAEALPHTTGHPDGGRAFHGICYYDSNGNLRAR